MRGAAQLVLLQLPLLLLLSSRPPSACHPIFFMSWFSLLAASAGLAGARQAHGQM